MIIYPFDPALDWCLDIGATRSRDGSIVFRVWAPRVRNVSVILLTRGGDPVPLSAEQDGYFGGTIADVAADERYSFLLDGATVRPDPASRYQPEGVHGPSQVVMPDLYSWHDHGWTGMPLESYIIYELHVGTYTGAGTFDGVIACLDDLCELGVTAVELMPVAQFPGCRNWGYDGTNLFAPQNSYGGPDGLKRLVDACHSRGLAVILDVVYNHLGPEGNYLHDFAPYFTDSYRTPWGDAVNFDGPDSDQVRHYFISNALFWITEYHIDALRLDAIHGIYDFSALHILQELSAAVHRQGEALGRQIYLIAECDLNDVRVLTAPEAGGYGLDAQGNDDFHHSLHALLTGERHGYYLDFGRVEQLAKAIGEGFVNDGCYSPYRRRRHGSSSRQRPARQFVICTQNHDQIGNRMQGERLGALVSFESLKLAAGILLLSPAVPLLFMGEEYDETAPFLYFIDHSDPALTEAVREGRRDGFRAIGSGEEPPDPADVSTFLRSRLNLSLRKSGRHRTLHSLYQTLISLRKESPALASLDKNSLAVTPLEEKRLLFMERWHRRERLICLFSLADTVTHFLFPADRGAWRKVLDSADTIWGGPGSLMPEVGGGGSDVTMNRRSLVVYRLER